MDDMAYREVTDQGGGGHEDYAVDEIEIPDDGTEVGYPGSIKFSWHKLWLFTGPGWLMSMAYLDPGNLTSDLQQGAYTKYQLIWVLWWSTVVGWVLQMLSARLGVVTGKNLAQHCKEGYPTWASRLVFVEMQLAIIGADIQEVLGSAIALKILFDTSLVAGCLITAVTTFGFLGIQKYGVRVLEGIFAFFIGIMGFCFCYNWALSGDDSVPFIQGWAVPYMDAYALVQAVGIIGAVIMPHNLYLHSGLVLSRKVPKDNLHKVAEANYYNSLESGIALLTSFFINVAIVATFAAQFFAEDCATYVDDAAPFSCMKIADVISANPDSDPSSIFYGPCGDNATYDPTQYACAEVGLELAGSALTTSLGGSAQVIWGIGLLCAGQAATTTATYAGQILVSGFFDMDLPMWAVMLITRTIALGPSVLIAIWSADSPQVTATMNEYLNVLQSIQLPFALIPVLHFTGDRKIMGEFANGSSMKMVTWTLAIAILAINVFLVFSSMPYEMNPLHTTLTALYMLVNYLFMAFLCKSDIEECKQWVRHGLCDCGWLTAFNPEQGDKEAQYERVQ
jgi:natural resistance-associated macrophage protein